MKFEPSGCFKKFENISLSLRIISVGCSDSCNFLLAHKESNFQVHYPKQHRNLKQENILVLEL